MTTSDIQTWRYRLNINGTWEGAAMPLELDDLRSALQSQAERMAVLERESETHAKAYGLAIVERDNLRHELKTAQEGWRCECSTDDACRFARERDALRAQLAAIAATEPVMFAYEYSDGSWHDASSTEHSAGMKPLFTRPMPAEVTELVEALEEYGRAGVGNSTDWRVQLSALRLATAALSKYKGAK